jgi:hypothetical protein
MVRYKWCSPVNFLLVKPMVGISRWTISLFFHRKEFWKYR